MAEIGHKIPAVENLGVAGVSCFAPNPLLTKLQALLNKQRTPLTERQPQDAIDFTDNDLTTLANFPLSPRLQTLLLARNRITSIQPTLARSIPNLRNLILTSNNISELADLDVLSTFTRLTVLVLLENPVQRKENYRYWVLWRCPSVRFLDYAKVKEVERKRATELFGTAAEPSALASKVRAFPFHISLNSHGN